MATCLLCSKDVTTGYVLCGKCAADVKLSTEPELLEHFVEWLGAEMANDFAVKPCSMCGREHCDDISQCRSGVTAWLIPFRQQPRGTVAEGALSSRH